MKLNFLFAGALVFCACLASAQQKEKRLRLTPLPVIYYSPETKLGFGALVAANFETVKVPDSITLSSFAQTYFLYTVNKQYDWGTKVRVYSPQNKFIFNGRFNYTYFPEYYFGISTEYPESKKDTIEYFNVLGDVRFFWQLQKKYYLGFATRFNRISKVNSGEYGSLLDDKPLGYQDYWIQGFAPAFMIESRDSFVYPRKGFYLEAMYYFYPSWNGDSYAFQSVKLDIRKYFPITWISELDALAFQFLANINTGDVPFKDMADIGGAFTMRGYYKGYYRYNNLYAFQAEYRTNIWRRLGLVAWLGAAVTAEKWYGFAENPVKPNAGIGLRVMFNKKDKLNVRLDQGFGKNQQGFYLDLAEAF